MVDSAICLLNYWAQYINIRLTLYHDKDYDIPLSKVFIKLLKAFLPIFLHFHALRLVFTSAYA